MFMKKNHSLEMTSSVRWQEEYGSHLFFTRSLLTKTKPKSLLFFFHKEKPKSYSATYLQREKNTGEKSCGRFWNGRKRLLDILSSNHQIPQESAGIIRFPEPQASLFLFYWDIYNSAGQKYTCRELIMQTILVIETQVVSSECNWHHSLDIDLFC